MEKIILDTDKEVIYEAFGISKKRMEELKEKSVDFTMEMLDGISMGDHVDLVGFLQKYLDESQNVKEAIFQAFCAGQFVGIVGV